MYPLYPDLAEKHLKKIKTYGKPNFRVKGGRLHNLITKYTGWKTVKLIHHFTNSIKKNIPAIFLSLGLIFFLENPGLIGQQAFILS